MRNSSYPQTPITAQTLHQDESLSRQGQLEVVLVVDEMRVISFDRFQMKLPSSVQYDDLVRVHLQFFKHYTQKKMLIS